MQPWRRRETGKEDLFRSRLDHIIDMKHRWCGFRRRWIGSSWTPRRDLHGSSRSRPAVVLS